MLFKVDLNNETIYKKDVNPDINLAISNGFYTGVWRP